jgi:hypothetical protein
MHKNNKSLRKQKKKSQVFDQNFENQRKSRFKKKKKAEGKPTWSSKSDQGLPEPGCPTDICSGFHILKFT